MAESLTIGKLFVQLLLDDDDFDLDDPKKKIQAFGSQLDSFANGVQSIFVGAMQAATASIAAFTAASAVVGATFEAEMDKVAVISGASQEGLEALTAKARELGATTAYSATEAAVAMALLAGAGLGVNQVLAATGDALVLAGAGGTSLDAAAASLTSTMAQFQLEATEAGRIADVFAKATASSQFTVEDLSEAMKYGGTVGAGFGWSLEKTVAALALFRDMGLQGSMAGTALRSAMVGATTASSTNVAVLEKYGLTMAQINPETNSFAEILTTVGKAGMTTSDAMIVFGTEAGAAVATLAEQFAQGGEKYQDLVDSLESATGTASTMYGEMQDNVLGSWNNLTSAVEELMLSTFDSFSGPLQKLLDALTETITFIAGHFQANAATIGASLEEYVGKAIEWLTENRELLAVIFTDGAMALVELVGWLGKMVPLLDQIAILLAGVFVAKLAFDFATAVQTAVTAIGAFRAALVAANVELTVSTGGLWAGVAAVGALVAAIATLTIGYGEAEDAARRLRLEQERIEAVSEATTQKILTTLGEEIAATKASEAETRKALAAKGELTSARRQELDLIRKSTEAELAQLVAQGKLVEHAGELRTVASLYEELEEDALRPVQDRLRALQQEHQSLTSEASRLERAISDWMLVGENKGNLAAQFAGFAGGLDEARARLKALQAEEGRVTTAIVGLTQANDDAQSSLLETYAKGGKVDKGVQDLGKGVQNLGKDSEDAARRAEEAWERAFQSATEAATRARERAVEGLEDAQADEEGKLRLSHERELRDLDRALQEELAKVQDNFVAQTMVEGEFTRAREAIEKRHAIEVRRFQWEETKAALQERLEETKRKLEEEKAARERAVQAMVQIDREGMTEAQRIDAEAADFFQEHASLTAEERALAEAYFLGKKKEALQEEKDADAQTRAAMVQNAVQTLQSIVGVVGQIGGAVVGAARKAYEVTSALFTSLIDLGKEAVAAVLGVFAAISGGEVSLDALSYIQEALEAIQSGEAGGATIGDLAASFVEEMAANAGLFMDSVVEALPSVISALLSHVPALAQKFADALPVLAEQVAAAIPGIIQALVAAVPLVVAALAEALPVIVAALSAAIPDLVGVLIENVPAVLQVVAENLPILVDGLVEAIPLLVQVVAENLPTLVQTLVDNLPAVIAALAASFPELVQSLAAQIPTLIQAVVDALPVVVQAIVDSIPSVVDALVKGIPILVRGVMDALPDLVLGVVEGLLALIPMLIEQLPIIVQGIVDLLPGLIEAILGALPEIITGIIRAIPQIVQAILGALPEIILAIISAIPDIVLALVSELPGMVSQLVVAIISALPEIVVALVTALVTELIPAIPVIIYELLAALWDGLVDLAKGLVDLIIGWFGWFGGGDEDGKDKGSNYSGIPFVPATMRGVTLHKGEAVLTAEENQRRLFGGAAGASQSNPSVPVVTPAVGGGVSSMEALFAVDGRIIDGVLIRANANGKGKVVSMMKRKAGVRSGVKTSSRFKKWSK